MCIHVRQHRQLLAVLLVAAYAVASTFGMAFVICVEGDGGQHVDVLGAACCASVSPVPAGPSGGADSISSSASGSDDCGDCQSHAPAFDIASPTIERVQSDKAAPVLLPPPALPVTIASPIEPLTCQTRTIRGPPPWPSPTLACLRSVVLRC